MSAQPEDASQDVIPRPERTVASLRAALAVVAPGRLTEFQAQQADAITQAVEADTLEPLRGFLLHWAVVVEIERQPQASSRLHRAEYLAQVAEDPAESRAHALAAAEIIRAAYRALGA